MRGPSTVGDLAQRLPVSRSAVSQHLKVLKSAQLVRDRQNGTQRIYELDPDGLARVRAYLEGLWSRALDDLQERGRKQRQKENVMTTATSLGAFVVEREIRIDAPRETVFHLLSDVDAMKRWFRPSIFEPRVGGRTMFVFPFDDEDSVSCGEITAYDPPSCIAFTWNWQSAPAANTEVRFDLIEEGASTLVRLTHTGFVEEVQAQRHGEGWSYWTGRLAVVAKGEDPGPDQHAAAEVRRAAVAELLREEIALKDHVERVAAQRRALPMPAPLDVEYTLTAADGTAAPLASLFGDKDDLLVYHLMFAEDDDEACRMCSMWVDGFNAVAKHVRQRAAFVVVAKAPVAKLRAWAERRGWTTSRCCRATVRRSTKTSTSRTQTATNCPRQRLPPSTDGIHLSIRSGPPRRRQQPRHRPALARVEPPRPDP